MISSNPRLARRLAVAAAVLVLMVIVASAWLRHVQAGLACSDWPSCYAAVTAPRDMAAGTAVARLIHRIAASSALIVIVLIPFVALDPVADRTERRIAWLALAIALALAALGLATPQATVPAVAVGNLAGGFALLATLVVLAARLRERQIAVRGGAITIVALVAMVLHAALGVMIGAQYAALTCPPSLACPAADLATLATSGILDPTREFVVAGGHVVAPAGAAALVVAHRGLSIVLIALALAAAAAVRADRAVAVTIVASALAAAAMGVVVTLAQPSLIATMLHNACAAVLTASLAAAAFGRGAIDRRERGV